jgi:hypothetical protein
VESGVVGNFASIQRMIFSAFETASEIQISSAGHGRSNVAILRAARMVAQIQRTRFRPSLTGNEDIICFRFMFAYHFGRDGTGG